MTFKPEPNYLLHYNVLSFQLFAENICTDILLPLYPRTATPTNFESKPQITYKRSILEIGSYESSPLLLPTMPAEN